MLRGPPCSGKSTLLSLLADYVRQSKEYYPEGFRIVSINGFRTHGTDGTLRLKTDKEIEDTVIGAFGYNPREQLIKRRTFLFIDDGHESYHSIWLWHLLVKEANNGLPNLFIVVAAQYNMFLDVEERDSMRLLINPAHLDNIQIVELDSKGSGRFGPIGLILQADEAMELIERRGKAAISPYIITSELSERLFNMDGAYVGGLVGMVEGLQRTAQDILEKRRRHQGYTITLDDFDEEFLTMPCLQEFRRALYRNPWAQGLPTGENVCMNVLLKDILSDIILNGESTIKEMLDRLANRYNRAYTLPVLRECWKQGWIYKTSNPINMEKEAMLFA